jgi:ABC-type multidrug transport system fused ATPase/permease subunit
MMGGGFQHGPGGGKGRGPGQIEPTKPSNPWKSFNRVILWIKPYYLVVLFGLICLLASTWLEMQPNLIIKKIIDEVIPNGIKESNINVVFKPIIILLGIYILSQLLNLLRTYWLHVSGQKLIYTLRQQVYSHMQSLSLTYFDNKQTGDMMSRMSGDIEQVETLMVHGMDTIISGFFGMLLAFYYMYTLSSNTHPNLALLVLIPMPLIAISIYFFSRKIRAVYRDIRDTVGQMNAKLQENFSGIRVIKAFNREEDEKKSVFEASKLVMDKNIRGIRMWSTFGPFNRLLGLSGSLIVLGIGSTAVIQGKMTVGALFAFWGFVGSFYGPIWMLLQFNDSIMRALAASERLFEVLDTNLKIKDPDVPVEIKNPIGEVEFENISFRYAETGELILKELSLHAYPGQRVALVGHSGAGKTTIINLIPRFYDVQEGRVLIDKVDVRDVKQSDLRKNISMVLQDTFLFNNSVKENLRYGKLDATDDEIIEAAKIANAHEFIDKLPDGYNTEIGERGVKLSGGQKQRIAIARAILANPKILILDEATSSVDSESEYLIHQALDRLISGRTTFIIAHRLSTIKNADIILVLEDGEVAERGTHDELIIVDGKYAQMHQRQFWVNDTLNAGIMK